MEHLGVERVDRIRLAGAFGSHIDVKYAMVLGMIPDLRSLSCRRGRQRRRTGARIALLDYSSRQTIETLVSRVEKIETALEPRFQQHFVEAMAIPHKTPTNSNLIKAVTLPPRQGLGGPSANARRRGRSARPVTPPA